MLKDIPLLPLRDVVVYPHMVIPLFVGREKSIAALEAAMASDKQIMLVAQRNASDDDPAESDIYRVGTVSTILQMLKLPDGTVKVLVEGGARGHISKARFGEEGGVADVRELDNQMPSESEQDALSRSLLAKFEEYVKLSKKVAPEIMNSVSSIDEVSRLADTISAHLQLKLEEKQDVLEMVDVRERVEHLVALMESDMDVLKVEKRIRGRVKKQMEKSQREYYLNEQMKAIQKELGDLDDSGNELEDLEKKIDNSGMPKDAKEKSKNELNKLRMMSPMSAEATVVRSYLDWMTSVPWK
ncbi:MAG TPA: endopeptidase La, partial [Alcanivorax sp.]|nr:endopeptidase La [Alcanivorax sp.]